MPMYSCRLCGERFHSRTDRDIHQARHPAPDLEDQPGHDSSHVGEAYDESWNRPINGLGTYHESDAAW